ncbi:MAG: response regulator [Candidatus Aminicenantes bacterium]|nr:response regulator [Candidatus Aminicenantes bacterium]
MKKTAYNLLVADKSPTIQKAVRFAFPDDEFRIFSITDGSQVMKAINRIKPDAMIISLYLPGKDGYDVARHFKSLEMYKETPLIFLRGAFEPLENRRIKGIVFDEIIREPFDSENLVRLVRKLVTSRKTPAVLPEDPGDEMLFPESDEEEFRAWQESGLADDKASFESDVTSSDLEISLESIREAVRREVRSLEKKLEERIRGRILEEIGQGPPKVYPPENKSREKS